MVWYILNMKTLKFAADLVPLVLEGEKDVTWRLWDDKDLSTGDKLSLVKRPELEEFAKAKITNAYEKKMGEIAEEDFEGHERYESNGDMYKAYSTYYGREVGPDTVVGIVRFKLL